MANESSNDTIEPELAELSGRFRGLRAARGWTLEELAERSGLSKAFLSRLEAGSRQPSIAAVLTLARVYGVPMGSLFEQASSGDAVIVVRGEEAPMRQGEGVTYTPLSGDSRFNIQPMQVVISPGRQGSERYQHEGEEWVYVAAGRLRLLLGEKIYDLKTGDAAHFDSRLPHRLEALDDREVTVILAACPLPIALTSRRETAEPDARLVG